jgi:hypothetical protein
MVQNVRERRGLWDDVYYEADNTAATNIIKSFYTAWWTGARILFGSHLPHCFDMNHEREDRRRLDHVINGYAHNNNGLWSSILMDPGRGFRMFVLTSLSWFKRRSRYTGEDDLSIWETNMLAALVEVVRKRLRGVIAPDNLATVDVVTIDAMQVPDNLMLTETSAHHSQLFYISI